MNIHRHKNELPSQTLIPMNDAKSRKSKTRRMIDEEEESVSAPVDNDFAIAVSEREKPDAGFGYGK